MNAEIYQNTLDIFIRTPINIGRSVKTAFQNFVYDGENMSENFETLLGFFLVGISLSVVVAIFCSLIKKGANI